MRFDRRGQIKHLGRAAHGTEGCQSHAVLHQGPQSLIVTRLRQAAAQLTEARCVMLETCARLKADPEARYTKQSAGFQMLPLSLSLR